MQSHSLRLRASAECWGTFLLVFLGCGSAVFSGGKLGLLGVALCFGLTLMILVYSIGPVSGCHVNPAITLLLTSIRRISRHDALYYIGAQIGGAVLAGLLLRLIAIGQPSIVLNADLVATGYGLHSPSQYDLMSCFLIETIVTTILLFLVIVLTHSYFPRACQGIVMGAALFVLICVAAPITNASLNIARSMGAVVLYGSGWAFQELWLFTIAQLCAIGCALGVAHVVLPTIIDPTKRS